MYISSSIIFESADEYHARSKSGEYLSSHMLADFRKCPKLYEKKTAGIIDDKPSSAFLVGRAAHSLILEGRDAFEAEYVVNPYPDRRAKGYKAWAAEQEKSIINNSEFSEIEAMAETVLQHQIASEYFKDGIAEGVVRSDYCGVSCQIRMDYWHPEFGLIDLKTTADMDGFERDMSRYGYAYQLAFYRAVLREVTGKTVDVHVVAVEKAEPYRCGVWKISPELLDFAERENKVAIDKLLQCKQADNWPTGYEVTRFFDAV